jgi:uncharacterized repeat protein (TIGR01451 family)
MKRTWVSFVLFAMSIHAMATVPVCSQDSQCSAGQWCNETNQTCVPDLANGTPLPNDPAHTSPTLNGICTAAASALVCQSGVCDTDNRCGYANEDGPCSAGNGGVVCRSGACSVNSTCMPSGGCNLDPDCSGTNWCQESAHQCTPRLANAQLMPSDPAHASPTLDGTCTPSAASLVCISSVCDSSNNSCGFENGDGTCSQLTAGIVCDSGDCSVSGACEPSGGCLVDGDCVSGYSCHSSACVVSSADISVANGGASPNPVLSGANITYTINVGDAGPDSATSVEFLDSLPAQTSFVSLNNPAGWNCIAPNVGQSGAVACSLASLATGTAPFTLVVQTSAALTDGTIISNTPSASSSTGDPNSGNDSQTTNVIVYKPIFSNGFE